METKNLLFGVKGKKVRGSDFLGKTAKLKLILLRKNGTNDRPRVCISADIRGPLGSLLSKKAKDMGSVVEGTACDAYEDIQQHAAE
ncbi:unnamed protein product [Rhizopus microsporus]